MIPFGSRFRLFLVSLAGAALWLLLFGGLVRIQVFEHETYRERADRQHTRRVVIHGNRGRILDRTGEMLAGTLSAPTIVANPSQIRDLGQTEESCRSLSALLGLPIGAVRGPLAREGGFAYIARKVDPDAGDRVAAAGLAGIACIPEKDRIYPYEKLARPVVGITDVDMNGIEGIEKQFDSHLSGEDGWKVLQAIPSRGPRPLPGFPFCPPRDGCDVLLTLDTPLQSIVELELERAVEKTEAACGMALAMEPSTGDILAMATVLSAQEAREAGRVPLMNRCVAAQFEPGSTFKIVTYSAAFEEDAVSPLEVFNAGNGEMSFGSYTIHEARTSRYDRLLAREGFEKSSNIVSAQIAYRLGGRGSGSYDRSVEKLYSYARAFGFGARTGIALPGEVPGVLRRPADWSGRSLGTVAYGQEIAVNLVQLASAYAAIANDGVLMEPRIVREIRWPDGSVRERIPPRAVRRVVSSETAALMRDLMRGVVDHGTGKEADLKIWPTAGKTGTAEMMVEGGGYSETRFTPSFIGFAPADDPEILLAVVLVDVSKVFYGGVVAGPVFREILLKNACSEIGESFLPALQGEAVATWAHAGEPTAGRPAPAFASAPADTMPDLSGLFVREAKAWLLKADASVRVRGAGTVAAQDPPAGTPLRPGVACSLVGSEP